MPAAYPPQGIQTARISRRSGFHPSCNYAVLLIRHRVCGYNNVPSTTLVLEGGIVSTKDFQALELATLYQRAKRKVAERAKSPASFSKADVQRLAHELEVQHIELELEIEELRQSRADLEGKYRELYEFAPVAYFSFDINGTIVQTNATGADLLGLPRTKLLGRSLAAFLKEDFRHVFGAFLARSLSGEAKLSCSLALTRTGDQSVLLYMRALGVGSTSCCKVMAIDVSAIDQSLQLGALATTG